MERTRRNTNNYAFSSTPHSQTYHLRIQNMISPLTNRTNLASSKREQEQL